MCESRSPRGRRPAQQKRRRPAQSRRTTETLISRRPHAPGVIKTRPEIRPPSPVEGRSDSARQAEDRIECLPSWGCHPSSKPWQPPACVLGLRRHRGARSVLGALIAGLSVSADPAYVSDSSTGISNLVCRPAPFQSMATSYPALCNAPNRTHDFPSNRAICS